MLNVPPGGRGPEPAPTSEPFEFRGETPPELARHLAAYAQHQAAATRFDAGVRAFDAARLRHQIAAGGLARNPSGLKRAEAESDLAGQLNGPRERAPARTPGPPG